MMKASEENDISQLLRELLDEKKTMQDPPYVRVPQMAGFNSLVGGLPIGALFGVYGAPQTNKSIMFTQFAWTLFPFGTNALLIDTEGGAGSFSLNAWVEAFNKRYKTDIKIVRVSYDTDTASFTYDPPNPSQRDVFFVLDLRSIVEILHCFGYKVRLDISEAKEEIIYVCPKCSARIPKPRTGAIPDCPTDKVQGEPRKEVDSGGKVDIKYNTSAMPTSMPPLELDVRKTPIGKFVKENNVKYVLVDSVTNPTEIFGPGGQMNNPGRDNANGNWFQQMQSLAEKYNTTIIAIFHYSLNPTNMYDKRGHPIGGKAVNANFKFLLLLQRPAGAMGTPFSTKAEKVNVRNLSLMRHPRKEPFKDFVSTKLTDDGFMDMDIKVQDD